MRRELKDERRTNAILFSAIVVLVLIIVTISVILIRSTRPMRQAQTEAVAIAKEYANIETVDDFYWFTWGDTYFSVVGTDTSGAEIAAIIAQDSGTVKVVNQADGYTDNEIRSIVSQDYNNPMIESTNLGMYNDQVAWEIVTKGENNTLTYYLLSFETGEELKVVSDI